MKNLISIIPRSTLTRSDSMCYIDQIELIIINIFRIFSYSYLIGLHATKILTKQQNTKNVNMNV